MKNRVKTIICCLTAAVLLLSFSAYANNTAGEVDLLIGGIVAYKEPTGNFQKWLDTELTDNAGVTSEWYVIALRQYRDSLDYTLYINALKKYLNENTVSSASSRLKYALTLVACNMADDEYVKTALNNSIGKQGLMSWVFGLHLMNNGISCAEYTVADTVSKLLSLQLDGGGWSINSQYPQVDATAMTVQALVPYYSTDETVHKAVDSALMYLSESQLDGGDYSGYGAPNPESTAQVLTALSSVGINPLTDERFIKNGKTLLDGLLKYRLENGSFCHTPGGEPVHSSTTQAFYSLVALQRFIGGLSPLYIFRDNTPHQTDTTTALQITEAETTVNNGIDSTDTVKTDTEQTDVKTQKNGYKLWVCIAIAAVCVIICIILLLCKKNNIKNFIAVILICACAVAVVLLTDFSSAADYYNTEEKENITGKVTISIRCDSIVSKSDSEYIPSDGIILSDMEVGISDGETIYDILIQAAKKYGIQLDAAGGYISGINYIYEFDFGELSGWVYRVNGKLSSVGCKEYTLSDGDVIEWSYSCEPENGIFGE